MSLYTIAQASEEVDLTPYTLRYYEKEGLLPNVTKDSAESFVTLGSNPSFS